MKSLLYFRIALNVFNFVPIIPIFLVYPTIQTISSQTFFLYNLPIKIFYLAHSLLKIIIPYLPAFSEYFPSLYHTLSNHHTLFRICFKLSSYISCFSFCFCHNPIHFWYSFNSATFHWTPEKYLHKRFLHHPTVFQR